MPPKEGQLRVTTILLTPEEVRGFFIINYIFSIMKTENKYSYVLPKEPGILEVKIFTPRAEYLGELSKVVKYYSRFNHDLWRLEWAGVGEEVFIGPYSVSYCGRGIRHSHFHEWYDKNAPRLDHGRYDLIEIDGKRLKISPWDGESRAILRGGVIVTTRNKPRE